jgi:hypothetical protein
MQLGEIPEELPEIILKEDPLINQDKWKIITKIDPSISDIFDEEKGELRKQEMRLSYRLVEMGWTDQEVADAIISLNKKREIPLKKPAYYGRIIAITRNTYNSNAAEELIEQEYDLGKQSKIEPEVILESISSIFKFKVYKFVKYLSDPPSYRLETELGNIELGDDCLSQIKFRRAIVHYGDKVIKSMKPAQWEKTIQLLLDVCEKKSMGSETTDEGAMKEWLKEFLKKWEPEDVQSKGFVYDGASFKKDGKIYIYAPELQKRIFTVFSENLSRRQLGTIMRKTGLKPSKVRIGDETINCWKVPDKILKEEEDL